MILDTQLIRFEDRVGQVANTELSKRLLDADLSNLGQQDFFERLELVRRELGVEEEGFAQSTLELISRHTWHSRAATELRLEQERLNIQALKQRIP